MDIKAQGTVYYGCRVDLTVSHVISGSFHLCKSYFQRDGEQCSVVLPEGNLAVCLRPNVSGVIGDLEALQVRHLERLQSEARRRRAVVSSELGGLQK